MDKKYWREYYRKNAHTRKLTQKDYGRSNQAKPGVMARGAALLRWRQAQGLSQKELAGKIGCTQSAISAWERGVIPVNMERITAVLPDLAAEIGRDENAKTVIHT